MLITIIMTRIIIIIIIIINIFANFAHDGEYPLADAGKLVGC